MVIFQTRWYWWNERVWAEPEEAYVIDNDGNYVVVPEGIDPPDTLIYFPRIPTEADDAYQVILEIDDVDKDPGFGYQPGDTNVT